MKKIKKFFTDNWILLFIIIQPLLDMLYYFQSTNNFTPTTWIIRMLSLGFIVIYLFLKSKNKKKLFFLALPYGIFYLLHILNLYRVNELSIIKDTKYFIYVFMIPLLTFLFADYIKDNEFHIEKIKKGIFISFLIISGSLLLAVLTGTSQCTYYFYAEDACVGILGWFSASDTVFMIICAVSSWALYYSLIKTKWLYPIITAIVFIVLFSNSSRSCYLTLVSSLVVALYISCTGKDIKARAYKVIFTAIVLVFSLKMYGQSMTFFKNNVADKNTDSYTEVIKNETSIDKPIKNDKPVSVEEIGNDSLLSILNSSHIYREIIDIHGADAVIEAMGGKVTPYQLSDNRYRKVVNAKIEYNKADTLTRLLGLGYSRFDKHQFDLENDLKAVFFFYGYIGFALYMIFFIGIVVMLFKTFIKKPSIIIDKELVMLVFLFFLLIVGGEYTGAFLRKPNSNIYLIFFITFIILDCKKIVETIGSQNTKKNISKEKRIKKKRD